MKSGTLEKDLLLACVRTVCGTGEAVGTEPLPPLDWRLLQQIAERHRVFPLLFRALSHAEHRPPAADWEWYRSRFARLTRANLERSAELTGVLRTLARGGVEAVPLKGPVLGEMLYGTPVLRQFRDLDVLVPRESFLNATELLEGDGYRMSWPPVPHDRARKTAVMRHFDEQNFTFTHPRRRMKVELHWQFMRSGQARHAYEAAAFARRVPVAFCGSRVASLESADLLLLLCTHGAGHAWMRLSWLADLTRFLQLAAENLDWEEVWARAGRAACRRRLLFGVQMAGTVLHARVPDALRSHMRQDSAALTRAAAWTRPVEDNPRSPAAPAMVAYQLLLKDNGTDALRYLSAWVFKPRENVTGSAMLPAPLFPLYYVLWPLQVVLWPLRRLIRPRPRKREAVAGQGQDGA